VISPPPLSMKNIKTAFRAFTATPDRQRDLGLIIAAAADADAVRQLPQNSPINQPADSSSASRSARKLGGAICRRGE
jgi:hypothetical protein